MMQMTRNGWMTLSVSERSKALGDAFRFVACTDQGLDFIGLCRLFGLWQCSVNAIPTDAGFIWVSGLGLQVLGVPTQADAAMASKDECLAAFIPMLRQAVDKVRDGYHDPWDDSVRTAALVSALRVAQS